jgi:GT2 family glycosyltransferase
MVDVVERPAPSLRVHSVLFGNSVERLKQAVDHLERAADLAIAAGSFSSVELVWGDSSPQPTLDASALDALAQHRVAVSKIGYRFFDRNLGSAGGHNRLLEDVGQDCVLFMNPDVMLAPNALIELARPLRDARVGLVEARQLPVEHPKDYDRKSGETSWATTACAIVRTVHLSRVHGFDAESFFLYCDDVDLSWRLRLEGLKIVFQPSAVVFHDKRLSEEGRWTPSMAEKYYSAEAALMLAQKYSREDIARRLVRDFLTSDADYLRRAATTFEQRRAAGKLPTPLDPNHLVAEFVDGLYTRHRFPL